VWKRVYKKSNLKGHIRSVHDNITFDCTVCSQKFKHKHTLQKHKRTHTEEPVEPVPRKKKRTVDVLLGGVHPRMHVDIEEESVEEENTTTTAPGSTTTFCPFTTNIVTDEETDDTISIGEMIYE